MDMLVVEGGHPLDGAVTCSGSKNALLPIAAAALLTEEKVTVRRVPDLADVRLILNILEGTQEERRLEIELGLIIAELTPDHVHHRNEDLDLF